MPIRIPTGLPAIDVLDREGVMVMSTDTAARQDIRPLQIGLLNLMPNKERTETQFARLIGATPLQIDLTLIRMTAHQARNVAAEHLEAFYTTFEQAKSRKFDGLIITGAPIELLEFEEVTYWQELEEVFAWTQTNVQSTLAICWGAQAMLHHFHGVPKYPLARKAFGCYRQKILHADSPFLRGFSDDFITPVSRWTGIEGSDLPPAVRLLASSDATGPCMIEDKGRRAVYMLNHIEYDTTSLKEEYDRDVTRGEPIHVPEHYYPGDDPALMPENRWRSHAHLMFGNWINEIYQSTPFDIEAIGTAPAA
ncbi:MAG: homoserine O-succinyltransferase [Paracoccaceae bacterium]|jgi:homoserine O-succinyltransferase